MAPTIQWLLEQPVAGPLVLLAGKAGLNRKIVGVNIMDSPETLAYLGENELILASGYAFLRNANLRSRFIAELSKKGCAGAGFVLTGYIEKLPDEMLAQADSLGFPIFSIPYELSLSEINSLVYEKIFKDRMTEVEQVVQSYNELMTILSNNWSGDEMLDRIVATIGHSAIVADSELCPITYAVHEGEELNTLRHFFNVTNSNTPILPPKTQCELMAELVESNDFAVSKWLQKGEVMQNLYIMPIRDNNETQGYLCFCNACDQLRPFQLHYLKTIRPILSLFLARYAARTQNHLSTSVSLLSLLLSSTIPSNNELENFCKLHRFDYTSLRICILVRLNECEGKSSGFAQITENTAQECISNCFSSAHLNNYKIVYRGQIICFIFFKDTAKSHEAIEQCENMMPALHQKLLELNIPTTIGISKACKGVHTLRNAVHQAFDALELGGRIKPTQNIYSYDRNQMYHLLANLLDRQTALDIYNDNLGELHQFDKENQLDYEKTLRSYIENHLRINDTAKELYLHRNTLSSRIEKINDFFGKDLHDLEFLNRLLTSFYVSDLLNSGVFESQGVMLSHRNSQTGTKNLPIK